MPDLAWAIAVPVVAIGCIAILIVLGGRGNRKGK